MTYTTGHSGNATNASPYVWQTIAYFDEKKKEKGFIREARACLLSWMKERVIFMW